MTRNLSKNNTNKIYILSVSDPRTGLGRYGIDLKVALGDISSLVYLKIKKDIEFLNYGDKVIEGKYPFNGDTFNLVFSRLVFNKAFKALKTEAKQGSIIHISSHVFDMPHLTDRTVVTIHDLIPFKKNSQNSFSYGFRSYMLYLISKYSHYPNIVVVSNSVKTDILNNFRVGGEIKVIYPPVAPSFFEIKDKDNLRNSLKLPLDKKLILSISSAEIRKNLGMVEKVMGKLDQDFRLVRVGPEIRGAINFGRIDDPKTLNKIYNACDVLLFPSLEEGFGYPVVEAFATGLPVVASNIPAIRETAKNYAILINPNDIEEIIRGIYSSIENSSYYKMKGLERAKEYSLEKFRTRLNLYYEKIW